MRWKLPEQARRMHHKMDEFWQNFGDLFNFWKLFFFILQPLKLWFSVANYEPQPNHSIRKIRGRHEVRYHSVDREGLDSIFAELLGVRFFLKLWFMLQNSIWHFLSIIYLLRASLCSYYQIYFRNKTFDDKPGRKLLDYAFRAKVMPSIHNGIFTFVFLLEKFLISDPKRSGDCPENFNLTQRLAVNCALNNKRPFLCIQVSHLFF